MRSVDIKSIQYRDRLASQRRRRFIAKITATGIGALALIVGIVYALFFSPWFVIRSIAVNGLEQDHAAAVTAIVDTQLDRRFLHIPVGRNSLFFPTVSVAASLREKFSFLQDVSVHRRALTGLIVDGTERKPEGVWCFIDVCHYFDRDGVLWGDAVRSSGYLLLDVDDMRPGQTSIDMRFLNPIETVIGRFKSQNIKIKGVAITADGFTEFDVRIGGQTEYIVRFSLDSNIEDQLTVFRIFKEKKLDTGEMIPSQYVDVRFDGRAYYK